MLPLKLPPLPGGTVLKVTSDTSATPPSSLGLAIVEPLIKIVGERKRNGLPNKFGLDMGCGHGHIAMVLARLGFQECHAYDVDPSCIQLTNVNWKWNLKDCNSRLVAKISDGFAAFDEGKKSNDDGFDLIVSNPPQTPIVEGLNERKCHAWYHASDGGRSVLDMVISGSRSRLRPGGSLLTIGRSVSSWKETQRMLNQSFGSKNWRIVSTAKLKIGQKHRDILAYYQHLNAENPDDLRIVKGDDGEWYQNVYFVHATRSSNSNFCRALSLSEIPKKWVGVIGGSGPSAGVNLADLIFQSQREFFGGTLPSDRDSISLEMVSDARVGGPHLLSTWKDRETKLLPVIKRIVKDLAKKVDYIALACNTLHVLETNIQLWLKGSNCTFISIIQCVADEIYRRHITSSVAVLGSKIVGDIDGMSPYRRIPGIVKLDDKIQNLSQKAIIDIKSTGASSSAAFDTFIQLLKSVPTDCIVVSCTEFDLVAKMHQEKMNYFLETEEKEIIFAGKVLAQSVILRSSNFETMKHESTFTTLPIAAKEEGPGPLLFQIHEEYPKWLKWRNAYHQFRRGECRGSKNEPNDCIKEP